MMVNHAPRGQVGYVVWRLSVLGIAFVVFACTNDGLDIRMMLARL